MQLLAMSLLLHSFGFIFSRFKVGAGYVVILDESIGDLVCSYHHNQKIAAATFL